jgi:VWFA-related protein
MGRFLRFFIVLLLPLSFCRAFAQDNPPTQPQLQPRTAQPETPAPGSDRRITLDVQVTDKSGTAIRGLQQQDFTLLDDKLPQKIAAFQAVETATPELPLQVILIVDAVNTSFNATSNEKNELKKFLLQNNGKLSQPTSLVIFGDAGAEMQKGSSLDGNALAAILDKYELGLRENHRSQGFYGEAERYDKSLKALDEIADYEQRQPGRKLVIWISPGWPLLSGPRTYISAKEEAVLFKAISATSTKLRLARITIYSVDPLGLNDFRRAVYYEEFLKGVSSPSHALPGNLGLPVLAVQTGGRVLNMTNDITTAIAECVVDANSFYVISFDAPRADKPNEYHSLAITINKPAVIARTRTGYYAQP